MTPLKPAVRTRTQTVVPGGDAADGGFAAGEEAGGFPIGGVVGVADVGLDFVDAARARGLVTRDE